MFEPTADPGHRLLRLVATMRGKAPKRCEPGAVAMGGRGSVAGRCSRFVKMGSTLVASDSLASHHVTELASALGTLELKAGNDKRARRLFRLALDDLTENSLAPAEWASQRISGIALEPQDLREPSAFEARARSDVESGARDEAVEESWRWHADQPFDSDAAITGSYAAAVGLDDYVECVRLARAGLLANPDDSTLRNNLAFGLLQLGDIDAARQILAQISMDSLDGSQRAAHLATRWLLAYRLGSPEEGRARYSQAIAVARSRPDMQAMAAIMMAREELRIGTPQAGDAIDSAFRLSREIETAEIQRWRELLSHLAGRQSPRR